MLVRMMVLEASLRRKSLIALRLLMFCAISSHGKKKLGTHKLYTKNR